MFSDAFLFFECRNYWLTQRCQRACSLAFRRFTCSETAKALQSKCEEPEEPVFNEVNIQMISRRLRAQLFGSDCQKSDAAELPSSVRQHLLSHGVPFETREAAKPVALPPLPQLRDSNVVGHLDIIAEEQAAPYRQLLQVLAEAVRNNRLPSQPRTWRLAPGWTR